MAANHRITCTQHTTYMRQKGAETSTRQVGACTPERWRDGRKIMERQLEKKVKWTFFSNVTAGLKCFQENSRRLSAFTYR